MTTFNLAEIRSVDLALAPSIVLCKTKSISKKLLIKINVVGQIIYRFINLG